MKNMTIVDIANAVSGELHIEGYESRARMCACGVVIDSRRVDEGFVFIATVGARVDGHDYIDSVFDKGALAVICEKPPKSGKGPYILVEDSFEALKRLAAYYREQLNIPVIGITGSVGKTSTKELVASVVSKHYKTWKTQGNFNNEVGLPLTILQVDSSHEALVVEMGINHFGEMDRLSRIARPDIMIITNIGECHLEFLHDRDGVLKAKTECFQNMNPEGVVILNGDDDKLLTVGKVYATDKYYFGWRDNAEYSVAEYEDKGLLGSAVSLHSKITGDTINADIHMPGKHMVNNALVAFAVGEALDMTAEEIREGIEDARPMAGRSNIIDTGKYVVIDDCYNANPTSMRAALDLLNTANTRKVAIMGDMFELGENEAPLHGKVGAYASDIGIDVIITVGTLMRNAFEAVAGADNNVQTYYFEEKQELLERINDILENGDSILVKASHSMGFEEVVNVLKNNS